jgi:hypothetical protein
MSVLLVATAGIQLMIGATCIAMQIEPPGAASIRPALRRAVRRTPALIAYDVMRIAIIVLLATAIYLTARATVVGPNNATLADATSIAIAYAVVETRFLVAGALVVVDGAGPLTALRASWRLTAGNALRTVFIGLAAGGVSELAIMVRPSGLWIVLETLSGPISAALVVVALERLKAVQPGTGASPLDRAL